MAKLGGWFASVLLHAGPVAALAFFGATLRMEAPLTSVSIPPSTPVRVDLQITDPLPEFEVPPSEPRPFEVAETPLEFEVERDLVSAEDEAAPDRPVPQPIPPFDRPLPEAVAVQKVAAPEAHAVSPESVPEVQTETVAVDLNNPPPEYPWSMRRRRLEGSVLVEVTILADGTCGEATIVEDAAHDAFGKAALESVRKWKFQPATRGGRPVESKLRLRFTFKLQS
jgi:protein TonB